MEPGLRRAGRNLAIATIGTIAIHLAETPLVTRAAALVEQRRWGLVKWLQLPVWLEVCAAVVLMDYTLYLWHVLTHRMPGLWRFHAVHHIDLDLDASTAIRFHFGELALSAPWRVAQIVVIGTSPLALSIWQTGLLASILFHHSNLALPLDVERRLSRVIVTPRMHGIHHSALHGEAETNWSSGLSCVGPTASHLEARCRPGGYHDRRVRFSVRRECRFSEDADAAVRHGRAGPPAGYGSPVSSESRIQPMLLRP